MNTEEVIYRVYSTEPDRCWIDEFLKERAANSSSSSMPYDAVNRHTNIIPPKGDTPKLEPQWTPTKKWHYPIVKMPSRVPTDPIRAYHHAFIRKLQSLPAYFNYTIEDWQYALSYFNNSCAICGRQFGEGGKGIAMDHWLDWRAHPHIGTIPRNIVPMCKPCNSSKGDTKARQWLLKKYPPMKARLFLGCIEQFFASVRQVPEVDRETGEIIHY